MIEIYPRIYLASNSPRRRELLQQIGVRFDVILFRRGERGIDTDVDETPRLGEPPREYVIRIAQDKASAAEQRLSWRKLVRHPILAADTVIDLDGSIIGKPDNLQDSHAILRQLSGRSHRVLTAITLNDGNTTQSLLSENEVWFSALSDDDIQTYAATGEPMDKAGAYAIQGRAAAFIQKISGSYSGIMGLPLFETAMLLRQVQP
ncbi:MAG: Maf family nucleotide pyrophosphatase [Azoarcus sp.]|jgi:septum formation protein|nr:Maf family nucleotide pyrophosphatase [Azoarcus sp.]